MTSGIGRRLGLGAFTVYLFAPEAVIVILLGVAFGWRIALLVLLGTAVVTILVLAAGRSNGVFGRGFGTAGWDPTDYAQWTRYLVIRPIVSSLPASAAVVAAVVVTTLAGMSTGASFAVIFVCGIIGFVLGSFLWDIVDRRSRHD